MSTLKNQIKAHRTSVFRRAEIKRRDATTGLFETSWQDITRDVKRWGTIKNNVDSVRQNRFRFSNIRLKMDNREGRFNPAADDGSIWNGFASRQRTLLRIQSGFIHQTLSSSGIWTNTEFPTASSGLQTMFTGVIQGDMPNSDDNTVSLNIRPLTQVFRDFPADQVVGYSTGGMTAQRFVELLRDMTDGSGGEIFRPFFQQSSGGFQITATTINYNGLDSSGATDVRDKDVMQIIDKLGEAENFAPRVTRDGAFKFAGKSTSTATAAYEFHGLGSKDREFGHTIKKIKRFGPKMSNFYAKVQVRFAVNTSSAEDIERIVSTSAALTVNGTNNPWNLGLRTLTIDNDFIQSTSSAQSIASQAFTELSALKDEIEFSASFVPQLELLDVVSITYDSSEILADSLWDNNNWDTATTGVPVLIWDRSKGDAINLVDEEMKILSIEQDLDKFETRIVARET